MNRIEKLHLLHKACQPCTAKIIEFKELPEYEKFNFDSYEKEKDFIVYCEKCETFIHLNSEKNETIGNDLSQCLSLDALCKECNTKMESVNVPFKEFYGMHSQLRSVSILILLTSSVEIKVV